MSEKDTIRLADRIRNQLRGTIRDTRAQHDDLGRSFKDVDGRTYALYAMECFLRAVSQRPEGEFLVLKGGNLFRVWEDMNSLRPTSDLDMQRLGNKEFFGANGANVDIKKEVAAIVCTPEFQEETALFFDLEQFKVKHIPKGNLIAFRLEGEATLGPVVPENPKPTRIPFCLEVTYGPAPDGAIEPVNWSTIMPDGEDVDIIASRPEWMSAEKFHAVVTRGENGVRPKDYYDLVRVLKKSTFDDQLLHHCVRHVFEDLGQGHLVPEMSVDISTFSAAFATKMEQQWQAKWLPIFEGRPFDASRDPTFADVSAQVLAILENKGVMLPAPEGRLAISIVELERATGVLENRSPTPVIMAKITAAIKAVAFAMSRVKDPADAAWRLRGYQQDGGLELRSAKDVLSGALEVVTSVPNMESVIDRGWDKGKGGGIDAIRQMVSALDAYTYEPKIYEVSPEPKTAAPKTVSDRKSSPVKAPKKKKFVDPVRSMEEGVKLLSTNQTYTAVWFGGLAKVLQSEGRAEIPDISNVNLEVDNDVSDRVAQIWERIARKNGLNEELHEAVEEAQHILGMTKSPNFGF